MRSHGNDCPNVASERLHVIGIGLSAKAIRIYGRVMCAKGGRIVSLGGFGGEGRGLVMGG